MEKKNGMIVLYIEKIKVQRGRCRESNRGLSKELQKGKGVCLVEGKEVSDGARRESASGQGARCVWGR